MTAADGTERPLSIRLFGPFEARVNGSPLPRPRSRKGQWLLALLTLRHGAEIDRSWLAGLLWPGSDEAQALAKARARALGDPALIEQALCACGGCGRPEQPEQPPAC